MLFGVPDCGKVCSETHVPSFLAAWDELRQRGITRILCVAVGDPAAADAWAQRLGAGVADGSKVTVAADANGALTRFLGMEQGAVDAPGPRSLRYAAVVDDGTLLKVVRALRWGTGCAVQWLVCDAGCWLAHPPMALHLPPAPACSAWTSRLRRSRHPALSRCWMCSRPCTEAQPCTQAAMP